MKKYFPIFAFILVFTGFLSGQVLFDIVNISAGLSNKANKTNAHYEAIFSKLKLDGINDTNILPSKKNSKVVILNFWASWCKPCLEEFPSLNKLNEKYEDDDVLIIGINSDEESQMKKISKTIKDYNLNFPIVADIKGKIHNEFMISSIPVSIIFNNGKVIEVSEGSKDFISGETISKINEALRN